MRPKALAAAALCLAAVATGFITPVPAAADNTKWGADYFPNVTFTTQDGVEVRFFDDLIKGKIVAIDLIYTTCQYACPLETARLAQVQRVLGDRMGRDVFFYSITIDPEHDTPAVLKEYAEKYNAGPGWLFLTGKKADIELVSKKLGLFRERDRSTADGHVPFLLVGNQTTGQWMRNSALDNPKFLANTISDWLTSWRNVRKEPLKSYAEVPRLSFSTGQYTFMNHCAACHTVGRGDLIGPDLRDVTTVRDRAWLKRFILEPDRMRAEGDPIALSLRDKYKQVRMPHLDLTGQDAADLIEYLDEQSRKLASTSAASPAAAKEPLPPVTTDLTAIIDPYLRIQQALHADTLEGVADAARAIAVHRRALGPSAEGIQAAVDTLQEVADLIAARAAFGKLGDTILIAAKDTAAFGADVKVAFCPMAQKYWLQKGEKVQNPFYGQQMSECGRIASGVPDLTK